MCKWLERNYEEALQFIYALFWYGLVLLPCLKISTHFQVCCWWLHAFS